MTPYIYSMAELRRLVSAASTYQRNRSIVPPSMMRTVILLLYGAALRVSEARALKLGDVDLSASIITIRESKFFKSRLVPIGRKLTQVMREFMLWRAEAGLPQDKESFFFLARSGRPVHLNTIHHAFRRIRDAADVKLPPGSRWQPRLHDLRHSAAVHRVVSWYRAGKDVQKLLPHLSVYMGHVHLSATQVYLSMTPDLLREAGARLEKYATKEQPHD
jgi:site-specific recombinase XerD